MADFTTSFSFIIDDMGSSPYADGITFFLAQNNSVITSGYALGLPIAPTTLNITNNFVAVEFDTYWNDWDPVNSTNSSIGDHVGININSLVSVRTEKWWSNITGGEQNEAWISYNATSQNLSVVFTGFQDNAMVIQYGLYYTVDLRKELPEWVIFGFSASTGTRFEEHNVKSWSFNSSSLRTDDKKGKEKGKTRLMMGLSIGFCVLVGGLILVGWGLWMKRTIAKEKENPGFKKVMDNELKSCTGPKKFSQKELASATNNFAENNKLGEGGFGAVYRGFLKELTSYIAVKRMSSTSK
ncbi:hypothetical protein LguiA_008768 [Lonicera macranthoides]